MGERKKIDFLQIVTRKKSPPVEVKYKLKRNSENIQTKVNDFSEYQVEWQLLMEELRSKQDLERSRDMYQKLYGSVPLGYLTIDKNHSILEANATAAKMLSAARSVLKHSKFTRFVAPIEKTQDMFYLNTKKAFQSQEVQEYDLAMKRKDGSKFCAHLLSVPVTDNKNQVIQLRIGIIDITNRKQVEEALQESENRFREMFEKHQDMMLLIEPEGGLIVDANPSAIEFYGYPREVLCRMNINDINQLQPDKVKEQRLAALGRQRNQFIFPHRLASGEIRTVEVHSSPIKINHRQTLFSIIHDITDRKKAEEALKVSEEKYRSLVEQSSDGFAMVNSQGIITEWNIGEEKITGLNKSEVLGRPLWEVNYGLLPDERKKEISAEQMKSTMLEMLRTKQSPALNRPGELTIIRPDGTERTVLLSLFIVNLKNDFLIGSISRDITERKQAEEEIVRAKNELEISVKERTAQLTESEEKYRLLVDNANEVIIVAQDGIVKFVNKKGLEITDYAPEEIIGKPFLEFVHPDDQKAAVDLYQKYITGQPESSNYEFRINPKDGSTRWAQMNAAKINWEGIPAILAIFTDITENKKAEEARIRAQEQLERVNTQLKQFGHRITQVQEAERKRIAYELHDETAQYLSILKMQLGVLVQSGKISDPEIVKKLEYLEKDANLAFNDVRRYSHELRPVVLEHMGLLASLEQIAEDINKLKQFTVEVCVKGKEPQLSEEVKLGLFRIAQEALNNIRKHAKASKAIIKINFTKNQLGVTVIDDGIGFDIRDASTKSGIKGSLGLMSMRERADLIGASLKIESKPGQGTVVRVELPL